MDRIETSAELDFLSRPSYRHDDASHSISRAAASRRDETIDDRRHGNWEECLHQLILAESASLCTETRQPVHLVCLFLHDATTPLFSISQEEPLQLAAGVQTTHTHIYIHTHDSPRIFIHASIHLFIYFSSRSGGYTHECDGRKVSHSASHISNPQTDALLLTD